MSGGGHDHDAHDHIPLVVGEMGMTMTMAIHLVWESTIPYPCLEKLGREMGTTMTMPIPLDGMRHPIPFLFKARKGDGYDNDHAHPLPCAFLWAESWG